MQSTKLYQTMQKKVLANGTTKYYNVTKRFQLTGCMYDRLVDSDTAAIIHELYAFGLSKRAIAIKLNLTVYLVNKVLNRLPSAIELCAYANEDAANAAQAFDC